MGAGAPVEPAPGPAGRTLSPLAPERAPGSLVLMGPPGALVPHYAGASMDPVAILTPPVHKLSFAVSGLRSVPWLALMVQETLGWQSVSVEGLSPGSPAGASRWEDVQEPIWVIAWAHPGVGASAVGHTAGGVAHLSEGESRVMSAEQRREQAAVALLTAWLEDRGGASEYPATLMWDLVVELGDGEDTSGVLEGVLSLVAGLTSVAGELLVRSAQGHGRSAEDELQSLSLLFA